MVKEKRPDQVESHSSGDQKANLKRMELSALIQYLKASIEIVLNLD
jgi:hypothetical protein